MNVKNNQYNKKKTKPTQREQNAEQAISEVAADNVENILHNDLPRSN
jgi:hypothetical protein